MAGQKHSVPDPPSRKRGSARKPRARQRRAPRPRAMTDRDCGLVLLLTGARAAIEVAEMASGAGSMGFHLHRHVLIPLTDALVRLGWRQ